MGHRAKDLPSQYARMIPGTSAILPSRSLPATSTPATSSPATSAAAADAASQRSVNAIGEADARPAPARLLTQPNLTQPGVDRFTLLELVAADLVVLVTVCGVLSLFSPAWGLPWPYLPIFAVLVTLFGLREGLYKRAGDPSPAGVAPALARSTLFAIVLVFIGRVGRNAFACRSQNICQQPGRSRAVTPVPAGCMEAAEARNRNAQDPHHWRGPVAHAIALALRNDPLHRAIVCGFVDDNQPLSPMVLGRIADLDWLRSRRIHR